MERIRLGFLGGDDEEASYRGGLVFLRKSAKSAVSDLFEELIAPFAAMAGTSNEGGAVFLKKSARSAAEDRLRGTSFGAKSMVSSC